MEEEITIRDAIELTADQLSDISVPVALIEQIGIPIATAINSLRAIVATIDQMEPAKEGDPDV